jgi:hypothetical protein
MRDVIVSVLRQVAVSTKYALLPQIDDRAAGGPYGDKQRLITVLAPELERGSTIILTSES